MNNVVFCDVIRKKQITPLIDTIKPSWQHPATSPYNFKQSIQTITIIFKPKFCETHLIL